MECEVSHPLSFHCLVFKKEKTEMQRSKGSERTHQYKKELKKLGESSLKRVLSVMTDLEKQINCL